MAETVFYRRQIEPRLSEALEDSPVVLIHGPRQCGKTTLAQYVYAPRYLGWERRALPYGDRHSTRRALQGHDEYAYISFDDDVARSGARADPMGFVADLPERVILDESQLAPEIFPAMKLAVDRRRENGRFILTGSSNLLLLPALSESLAGRLQTVRLHPLAQYELAHSQIDASSASGVGFLDALFEGGFEMLSSERLGQELAERIVAGGFPPALVRSTDRRQANWYRGYVESLIQRDLRDASRIRALDILPRLLNAASAQTAQLYNLAALAAPFQVTRPTIGDYILLLERFFLLERLPPWHNNRLQRLVKTPKLHIGDTGLAAALLRANVHALATDRILLGHLLESFVFQELRKQATWHEMQTTFFHFRDKDGAEVDIVIEGDSGAVAGVEVKAAATVTHQDFRGLRKFAKSAGERFRRGVVLYDGEISASFGDRLHAVPIRRLWETT